ncbi:hypothetical protein MMC09_005313 [Bachmanniomyces sp. S44760]|nr:hypothetical protein [Bachmanniomyces sp. S44760]
MALTLAGKTAIVTGAGSGINLCFARQLLSRHCNVIFADLALRPEAEELVASHESSSKSPAKAVFQKTDVRNWQQLSQMFRVADEHFGGADIVCPGAGVYEPPFSSFWYPPGCPPSKDPIDSSRYAILDINLTHPIRTTQLALSHFLNPSNPKSRQPVSPSNPKSILHITSTAGQVTPIAGAIYNATKHAINGFVRSLGPLDEEIGVRVTAVAPGVIKTPMWTEDPDKFKLITDRDEWVTPEFVAETMMDLLEKDEVEVISSVSASATTGLTTGDERQGTMMIKVQGGTILEVSKGKIRKVNQFMDPGPSGEGNTAGNMIEAERDIYGRLRSGRWGRVSS